MSRNVLLVTNTLKYIFFKKMFPYSPGLKIYQFDIWSMIIKIFMNLLLTYATVLMDVYLSVKCRHYLCDH